MTVAWPTVTGVELVPRSTALGICAQRVLRHLSFHLAGRVALMIWVAATLLGPTAAQEPEGRSKGFFGRLGGTLRSPLGSREAADATPAGPVSADELRLRLRMTWGGGTPRAWQGELRLSQGVLSDVVNLGREADDPGSMEAAGRALQIVQPSVSAYGGCDLTITGPAQSEITVELAPRDRPTDVRRFSVRLDALLAEPFTQPLDENQNRVHVARVPGDRLRVEFDRDLLVFQPGEEFAFTVQPNALGLDAGVLWRARIWLSPARGSEELWKQEFESRSSSGDAPGMIGPVSVKMPEQEGVYDIHIELIPRRLTGPLSLGRSRPIQQRIVQVAVISPTPPAADTTVWKTLAEFDPAAGSFGGDAGTSRWSDWITRIPTLKAGGTGWSQGPLGNQLASRKEHRGRTLVSLATEGWMAYPLPVNRVDEPHMLEVEYPGDVPQTLGISLVEPNAAGRVAPLGLDSGIEVGEPLPGSEPGWQRQRIVFWPRTRTPLVVLVNRSDTSPAVFGRLAVQAGPARLSPPPNVPPPGRNDSRLAAALLDRPVFPENFGAGQAFDSDADGVWDDWLTFYQGGVRLVEYLKYAGYNSAVIAVACEGSAIYPSRLLEPTPKYDSGVFFSGGNDPVRKDVLELLFRLFDREGLKLIPAVQFATPLPELERLRRQGGGQAAGLEWIGADGQSWRSHFRSNRGLAPYYNLLDTRVQQATLGVVDELEQRYAHHDAWAGLSLQLGPDTYATLPGAAWGLDDRTVATFTAETGVVVPGQGAQRFAERGKYLAGDGRSRWLAWRASVATNWYAEIQRRIARRQPQSQLLLAGADLVTSPVVQQFARPALPVRQPAADALLAVGLDPKLLAAQPGVILLRPYRSTPVLSLAAQGPNLEWNRSAELDRLFASGPVPGGLAYHESLPLALPSFDKVSPFGAEQTYLWMASHFVKSEGANRQRLTRCLSTTDARIFVDGGWMLPIGGEDALRPALATFRGLPAARCESVSSPLEPQRQAITMRQVVVGNYTFVYLLNDAPWSVSADIQLDGPRELQAQTLGLSTPNPLVRAADGWHWRVALGPHDLRALRIASTQVAVRDWQAVVDPDVAQYLSQRVKEVRARANQLRSPQAVETLKNSGFETASDESASHWLHSRGAGIKVVADSSERHGGQQCLRVQSDKEIVWVRSEPIPTPATGRIAVWAWIKARDPAQPSAMRLAIEGRLDGKTYYRYASVGGASKGSALQSEWTQYWFQIDDLPPTGLTDLRIGFDLMGPGEVWIDDVQLFDLWFYDNERDELVKHIGLADFNLSNGRLLDCDRFLDGYWPRFLQQHVPLDQRLVQLPPRRPTSPAAPAGRSADRPPEKQPEKQPDKPPEKTSWKKSWESLLPKRLW